MESKSESVMTTELVNPQEEQTIETGQTSNSQEIPMVGDLMGRCYRRSVEFYRREYQKSLPEAMEMANKNLLEHAAGEASDIYLQGCRDAPPAQVSWYTLQSLGEHDPEDARRKWEEVKAWAVNELQSGMRGADAMASLVGHEPIGHARYLVLVREMEKDWLPVTGIEHILFETMAQAYTMQLFWTTLLSARMHFDVLAVDQEKGTQELPRVMVAQAVDTAAGMVDRWQRMFMRTLRQLRDLRRYSPVVINHPEQVNIGQQQVNVKS